MWVVSCEDVRCEGVRDGDRKSSPPFRSGNHFALASKIVRGEGVRDEGGMCWWRWWGCEV